MKTATAISEIVFDTRMWAFRKTLLDKSILWDTFQNSTAAFRWLALKLDSQNARLVEKGEGMVSRLKISCILGRSAAKPFRASNHFKKGCV